MDEEDVEDEYNTLVQEAVSNGKGERSEMFALSLKMELLRCWGEYVIRIRLKSEGQIPCFFSTLILTPLSFFAFWRTYILNVILNFGTS